MDNGTLFTEELFKHFLNEETEKIKQNIVETDYKKYEQSANILNKIVSQNDFIEFLTLEAYQYI